ncbi:hypothetical protein JBKA6_0732 [Ichthyobacterium seriolicida]|uniref:Uncharacterized protein n=1 Tax=Ichthyobacterium seriolicida TaxID=242600 RepID=A0A1J1DY13_9FLAO|nr:hypothetical protein JBKA6_0732 [Ichthyobacterium seriolicida]
MSKGQVLIDKDKEHYGDMNIFIEQLLSFGQGAMAHDDAPYALEGAIILSAPL